ncbi:putative lipid II flippase FtsW [bacterium]|nr:putative lipid II flippase FtsW [bacterium]
MQRVQDYDRYLLLIVMILLGFGIIMIYSSSAIYAGDRFDNPDHFLTRQLIWLFFGLSSLILFLKLDYRYLRVFTYSGMLLCFLALVLVLNDNYGLEVNGARRWLSFGFMNCQPSEFAKLLLTLFLACYLAKNRERLHEFKKTLMPMFVIVVIYVLLIALEPDLGTVVIITGILFSMLFLAGFRIWYLAAIIVPLVPFMGLVFWCFPHARVRILTFLNPELDPLGSGFHLIQSKIGIGCGGISGSGFGYSIQKLGYLPEPHTDFIYSVLCEELGFVGGIVIIILFGLFIWRGMRIALRANDFYGSLLAAGITTLISLQAFVNLAVVMGMLPTKGLALPFISFGGSNLLTNLTAIGILLNISDTSRGVHQKLVGE